MFENRLRNPVEACTEYIGEHIERRALPEGNEVLHYFNTSPIKDKYGGFHEVERAAGKGKIEQEGENEKREKMRHFVVPGKPVVTICRGNGLQAYEQERKEKQQARLDCQQLLRMFHNIRGLSGSFAALPS